MKTNLLKALFFSPVENSINVYKKDYDNHTIKIDLDKDTIDFGDGIFFNDSKNSTQNIIKPEDLVVLECVDRLLTKGYKPNNITLEKVYPSGHGTSGRLDILVKNGDGSAYMMIECKTWGKEFDKEFNNLNKNGGQLFTYFQQDKDAEVLVLYVSHLVNNKVVYINQIIKIEEEYKTASNVKDCYDRWNKLTKNNGIFDDWVSAYNYESKALTPKELIDIKQEDSSFIFNRFMEILRHNVVSDKPNAFSKIFTLFLCKIMDEKITKIDEELGFQWFEGRDIHISFQKRLTDLYQKGMKEFLDKEVTDLSDDEFEEKFGTLDNSIKQRLLDEFTKIRLQKNNEFAIKDVFDQDTFDENAIVVKEVVELLQNYKIRYTKKQQFLSDFFELLLTTGLKQEVGQFFTPVPIAKFIIRSIPFDKIIYEKLSCGEKDELLPNIIDYAVGSGHFITEAMDEIQKNLNIISYDTFISDTAKKIKSWKEDHFDWAYDYVYGIEKDYRLVKTAKVGCYLHGDGLAKVIHGDGLSNFTQTKEFKAKLAKRDKNHYQDNKQFDMVLSNPPYSVSAFKNISKKFDKNDFELYDKLTDQSSEIEVLFIERTKQLLKDGGIAGIILPSSILNNSGIYTKAREIIFKYFDIVSITELGSNTFMATGTNTVILFLRRKNNILHKNIEDSVKKLFESKKDITINGIENPLSKYISHVWEGINFEDYLTLIEQKPNDKIFCHDIYKEYDKKIKESEKILSLEKEKLLYFILAYPQQVTLIKTGEKKQEKKFLGYEFSNRRGSEGIHPTKRGKSIDECTSLYDNDSYENDLKANAYVYSAFNGEFKEIDESLKNNISYVDLVDMMTFDRVGFEKNISLSVKKKVNYMQIWRTDNLIEIDLLADVVKGKTITQEKVIKGNVPVIGGGQGPAYYHNKSNRDKNIITVSASGAYAGFVNYFDIPIFASDCNTIKSKDDNKISTELIYIFLKYLQPYIYDLQRGQAQPHVYKEDLIKIKIPLPPKEIQEKIVKEIEDLEEKETLFIENIKNFRNEIIKVIDNSDGTLVNLGEITSKIGSGSTPRGGESSYKTKGITLIRSQNIYDDGMRKKGLVFIDDEQAKKLDNVTVEKNDILFNITGASVARCCMVEDAYLPARVNQHVLIIRTNNKALSKYIQTVLINTKYKAKLLEIAGGGTSREAITKIQLEEFKILLPSFENQKEIVSQIKTIEKQITKQEKELASIPQQKEDILKKYLK